MKNLLIGLSALAMTAVPAQAVTLYGVTDTNSLVRFDSRTPGTIQRSVAIQGLGNSTILAMDFRVADGFLYALTDNRNLFRINANTGASRLVIGNLGITGSNFAFDFNPTNTNLRIVSNDNTNYFVRFNAPPIALVQQANAAFAPGTGLGDPDIIGAAYTFNDKNAATGTTLFVLDSANDLLATLNVANGTLTRVGALGVNIGARSSFDISGANTSFVLSGNTLSRINLTTGALTRIGSTTEPLFGLSAAVPEPATWGMMIIGFGAIGAAARSSRRNRKPTSVTA
jgi:Domain of unknown function (DUF4394)/PEP-CTERM motif